MELTWEEPPPPRHVKWDVIYEALKARPGQWAKVQSGLKMPSGAQQATMKRKGFEATYRREADGCALYARWPADS